MDIESPIFEASSPPTPPRIHRLIPPKRPLLLCPQTPAPTLTPPLPPAQPNHQRRRVIRAPALPGTHLHGEFHQRLARLGRRARFLDDIHDFLVVEVPAHAVGAENGEGVVGGGERGGGDLRLGADADAFAADVAEGAGVGEAEHALFAEGVGDEACGVAAEAAGFDGRGGVVVCCEGKGFAVRGAAEEDAGVAYVGGD